MTLDGFAGSDGVEPLDSDCRGTQMNRRGVRGPDAEAERRGDHREEHIVGCEFAVGDGLLVEVVPPVLGVDNAFGQSGGTRRGVDQEDVVGPHGRKAVRVRRSGSRVDGQFGRALSQRHDAKRGVAGGLLTRREQFDIGDHERRPRGAQDRGHLAHSGPGSESNGDRSAAFDGDQQNVNGRGVLVPDRHPVAGCDPERAQSMGEVGRGVVELGPGQHLVRRVEGEVDVGRFVRCRRGVAYDAFGQSGVRPPAGSAVLRCFGVRDSGSFDAHHKII